MGYLRRPVYYKEFQCIASACTDTCCAGWEIDVDDETLEKYRSVKGDFAKRLWNEIELPENEDGEPAHFKLAKCDRCPFLNAENLCDIFINLGEDYLSYICTHHPRYYEWYMGGKEAGLGLVCEAAAELILRPNDGEELEELHEDDVPETEEDEDLETELELEEKVFALRARLFSLIKNSGSSDGMSFDHLCDGLWQEAEKVQAEYEDLLFAEESENIEESDEDRYEAGNEDIHVGWDKAEEQEEISDECSVNWEAWSEKFWTEQNLKKLLDFYLHLEINDPQWRSLLKQMKEQLSKLLRERKQFLKYYKMHVYEYERLLVYFLYRYFMKARYDGELKERISFALISTCMIQLVGVHHWLQSGELKHKAQIDICKMYAKEIEYDEGNVDEINQFLF